MDVEPLDLIDIDTDAEQPDRPVAESNSARKSTLNTYVAISVALLATFIGICKVKDDNIVQAMQQAQANRVDDWALYQARNLREEIASATVAQLEVQRTSASPEQRSVVDKQIAIYQAIVQREEQKKQDQKKQAEADQATYDGLNFHDDQFDLSDAALSIAISLLAITSLTQKRWLFLVALIPALFGLLMGTAGLCSLNLHPDALIKPLSKAIEVQEPVSQPV
jgi:hypothetical protein